MKELKKINRYIMCFFLGSRLAYAENIDSNTVISDGNISGSLNIGIKNNANVDINGTVNIKDYFSVATCNGQSSTCPEGGLIASANIDKSASVGASVTIVGDSSKGELNIDGGSTLYTQQLWVSGNDNDKTSNVSDDSNGSLKINNGSNVFVVSSQDDTPFKTNPVKWNQNIISQGNNITDGTVSSGDLVLGKTGNGIIDIDNNSKLDVKNDVVVSTGVDGIPNEKPSEINIKNESNFSVHGDMKGGISAAGKLNLNMDNSSNLHVDKNIAVGIGRESNITVSASRESSIFSDGNFTVATGNNSNANLKLDASNLSVNGVSTIGSGDGSITKFDIKNGSVVTSSSDMTLAKGKGTQANINISSSELNTGSLSVGEGDNADVKMTGSGASVSSKKTFTVAKGNNASATLNYTGSKIDIGSGYIGEGESAKTQLELNNSALTASGKVFIGQGNTTQTNLTLNDKSSVNVSGEMSVAQGSSASVDVTATNAVLSADSLSLGGGEAAKVTMTGSGATVSSKNTFTVAKGNNASATLDYTDSKIDIGSGYIGEGEAAKTQLELNNSALTASGKVFIGQGNTTQTNLTLNDKSSVNVSDEMSVAQGSSASVDVTITNAVLSADSLSLGGGEAAKVTMTGNRATISSGNTFTVAKGNNASATLDYSDSKINIGNGYIGGGEKAQTVLTLKDSALAATGDVIMGQGQETQTDLTLSPQSSIKVSGNMSIAQGNAASAKVIVDNADLSANSMSIGEGDTAAVTMTGNGATISSGNTFTVARGNNASATLDYSDSKINIGNGYIGVGEKSHTLLKLDNSTFHAAGNIDIGKGSSTIANVSVGAGSNMSIKGNASIGVGDQAKAKFSVKDSVLNIGSSLVLGQGNSTEAEMSVEHSQLYSGGLLLGTANNAVVSMSANNSEISVVGDYTVAKGDGSEATLIYKNSDINLGNGILGAGSGVKTDLSLDNSKFVASDGIIIGKGDNAITNLSISDHSVFKGERINIGNGSYSKNSISITGNSIFDFGSSQESTIGEGDYSQSLVTINDASVYGDGSLTLAKGNNSFAVLNLQDNAVTNANNISLATGLGSKAIVNVSNMNSGQFNPVSMGAGDGYAEVNFDGVNGYTLSTNFICMDSGSCADTVINVNRGTVSLSGTNDWKGQINVYDGTRLDARGNDAVDGILNVSKEAQVDFNGYSQHMTGIDNKGMIYLSDGSASSDVYLDKDYVAHDGSGVQFGIFGQKEADVMHVKGDTSGSSGIVVTTNSKNKIKKGGDILLVEVNGDSSGSFYLNSLIKNGKEYKVTGDYIDVGAWEYALNKKRKNWYLSVDMRPEPGAFINNSKSMLDMFALQRYDIPGQHRYPTLFENLYNNGMWIQFNNNSGSNSEVYDNLKTSYSLNTMMIGGDIYNWTDGYNYSHIGIMGGMGSAANKTTSTNNKRATGNVDGYTLGLYHVFQQNISDGLNESERQGLWTYSSIQYMDYDNSVSSTNNFKADYGVNGFRLTGEVGYLKNIGGIQPSDFYVEPKLYLSHTELSGGVVEDLQGGKITYPNSLTIIEPGVFFSYRKTHESTSNDEAMFKDYIKQSVVDAWFGGGYSFKTGNYSRTNFDSDMVEYNTSDNFALKSGVEFEFLKDARLLLTSSYSINNDRNLSFILGGNYYF
ncbi:TPA: autotransporter outer membrane beta-barrel domain-containing protein [Escherichia coli]|uniref:autotransporter outer membrane beta-barrel domain-containing protein n=2 Tax=Escherichia coli TaxID=562 RepID=UPI0005A33251|nr:autotransporter outer membrane beta-barrel domain-containing protein [Escherichia coli]AJG11411.1 putative autotransporter [Escherichia coli ECC-1470]EFB5522660.1 autotransporter outer membrane beta-barrel domain-containing protein [Escherichia coli]EFE1401710.1 autotransporter outer membrane beta-barrel domain-containing protein [Escherichia coli]EFH8294452.1 autotransporter outer membrane beta-barrel domain-containing protein [Escherichia coli]EFO3878630.1 autotransporter outer membrane b